MTNKDSTIPPETPDGRTTLASFMRFLAHELGNPVASIRMSSEMLLGGVPPDLHEQLAQMVLDEAIHMERLIEAAVYYASLAAVSRGSVELASLIEQAIARRGDAATFEVEHADGSFLVDVDVARAARMLDELLINAVESGATHVNLTTSRSATDWLQITITSNGSVPVASPLSRIFDLFYTTREGQLGLGASIALRIAQLHGGDASVYLTDDNRTALTIRFPV